MDFSEDKFYYYRKGDQELLIFGALEQFIDDKRSVIAWISSMDRNLVLWGKVKEESETHVIFKNSQGSQEVREMTEEHFKVLKQGVASEVFKNVTWTNLKSEGLLGYSV
jgi:hypothetical protein